MEELEKSASSETDGRLMGLPETESELDNLTEFNTAHNRRITMIGIPEEGRKKPRKPRLTFNEEEMIINPEDVDPSIGRFRNMIESTVIPKKRPRNELGLSNSSDSELKHKNSHQALTSPTKIGLYDDLPIASSGGLFASSLSAKLGMPLPNPAPDIDMAAPVVLPSATTANHNTAMQLEAQFEDPDEPKKKKYAKEAWPGKKPTPSLLV